MGREIKDMYRMKERMDLENKLIDSFENGSELEEVALEIALNDGIWAYRKYLRATNDLGLLNDKGKKALEHLEKIFEERQ